MSDKQVGDWTFRDWDSTFPLMVCGPKDDMTLELDGECMCMDFQHPTYTDFGPSSDHVRQCIPLEVLAEFLRCQGYTVEK